jgi:predicted transposase YbfD/YdcC
MATGTSLRPESDQDSLAIRQHFRRLRDPRRRRLRLHNLLDLVVIALCGVLCGAQDWQQIVTFARGRHDWLKRFCALPHGIPSHDTFERVFDRINAQVFAACFRDWIAAACGALKVKQVALDGKSLRHSGKGGLGMLHVVSAWATANRLILGEVACAEKSNEITAIPQLLQLLEIEGALVTIDAMGCQKAIAAAIVEKKADYLLTVKDNQPNLLEDIQTCLGQVFEDALPGVRHDTHTTTEKGHGRVETRCTTVVFDPPGLRDQDLWPKLCVIGMCRSERTVNGETSDEVRYFISSKRAGAKDHGEALRNHWGIENNLHWHLDITFGEDASRVQKRGGAENFAMLRRIALSLLQRHPDKRSIACKRLAAAVDTAFLEEILQPAANSGNL